MMRITTSSRIRNRFISGFIAIFLFLSIGILFQSFKNQYIIDEGGIFIPLNFINQSKIIYSGIIDKENIVSAPFPCGELQKSALREKISSLENMNLNDSELKLDKLWATYLSHNSQNSCKSFPEILDAAYKLKKAIEQHPNTSTDILARQLYSQDLNWSTEAFCLYAKDSDGIFLLSGHPINCVNKNFPSLKNASSRDALRSNMVPILSLAKNRAKTNEGQNSISKNLTLTIDPSLQELLNNLSNCTKISNDCPSEFTKEFKDISYATFTIMDANKGEVLAIGCYGEKCQSDANVAIGFLAGANIETPPASTEKLIFSYALGKIKSLPAEQLALQIKTSGQLDGLVAKRNEWWEKQAICDTKSIKGVECSIPISALDFAKNIGWNQNCSQEPNKLCGNSGILSPLGLNIFSPTSARVLVTADNKGLYINEALLKGPFMGWNDYDSIRQGNGKITSYKALESTSLLIQSVIGAGNNRVTSLGLAMLSSGIYQSSHSGKVTQAKMFISENSLNSPIQTSQSAAQSVLNGMQKVVTPAEKGWTGDGTANSAFQFVFNHPCEANCPIYAKTGTVSHQDKVFGGTTLFTGLVKIGEMSNITNARPKGTEDKIYSIGVIVHPNKKVKIHQASRMGMLLIKEISNHNE
jgi:hypothetical protein